MATQVDAARPLAATKDAHNTAYQKGNDNANTPNATWLTTINTTQSAAETHIPTGGVGVDNTLDAHTPIITTVFLDKVAATERFGA